MKKFVTKSVEETISIAQNIEAEKFNNMLICLNGDLGSGKTMFVKGFASGLGIKEDISSPTFNIIKEYSSGEMPLYHMDVYRLDGDIDNTGLVEYFDKDGVIIIEWADTIEEYLPDNYLEINFKIIDEYKRLLEFIPHGTKYEELLEEAL